MKALSFTWNEDANGWLSESFVIDSKVMVRIRLSELAPVVTLKQLADEDWANYGQTPDASDHYEITINPTHEMTLRLASPVRVKECNLIVF